MKYEVGPYKKPGRPLLAKPVKRLTKKSKALRAVEKRVRENIALEQKIAAANRAKDADAWVDSWYEDSDTEQWRATRLAQLANAESDYNSAPLAPTMPLEEPAVWGATFVGTKESNKLVEVRKAPASIADYAGGKSVANIAKFPCSKCRGSGRFISWAGRDCGPCNRCHGTGKQKTDPELAARKRAEKAERKLTERAVAMGKWVEAHKAEADWMAAKRLTFSFAQSMADALAQWGSLTENQLAAVQKCMARDEERAKAIAERKPDANVAGEGFTRMVSAFAAAKRSALKWPKFRVANYEFSLAGAQSANAGCLYVKRGSLYIGKITAAGAFFASRDATEEDKAEITRIGSDPLAAAVMHGKQTGC